MLNRRNFVVIVTLGLLLGIGSVPRADATPAGCRDADLILTNGKVITMDASSRIVQAIAVRDAAIVAAGTNEEVSSCAGPKTQSINLQGKTVLPGLIDVHTHAMEWAKGILRGQLDVTYPKVRSITDVVAMVRERASKTPNRMLKNG